MAGRDIRFALSDEQEQKLLTAQTDEDVLEMMEDIEEEWDEEHLMQSDKAWDGIHRCLTDGALLYENGTYPLNHCICGGKQLITNEDSWETVCYVTEAQVHDVAKALIPITQAWMREQYVHRIPANEYEFELNDEDFAYVWDNFEDVRNFYQRASHGNRAVVFSVDF